MKQYIIGTSSDKDEASEYYGEMNRKLGELYEKCIAIGTRREERDEIADQMENLLFQFIPFMTDVQWLWSFNGNVKESFAIQKFSLMTFLEQKKVRLATRWYCLLIKLYFYDAKFMEDYEVQLIDLIAHANDPFCAILLQETMGDLEGYLKPLLWPFKTSLAAYHDLITDLFFIEKAKYIQCIETYLKHLLKPAYSEEYRKVLLDLLFDFVEYGQSPISMYDIFQVIGHLENIETLNPHPSKSTLEKRKLIKTHEDAKTKAKKFSLSLGKKIYCVFSAGEILIFNSLQDTKDEGFDLGGNEDYYLEQKTQAPGMHYINFHNEKHGEKGFTLFETLDDLAESFNPNEDAVFEPYFCIDKSFTAFKTHVLSHEEGKWDFEDGEIDTSWIAWRKLP
jgi:hypothetical protein